MALLQLKKAILTKIGEQESKDEEGWENMSHEWWKMYLSIVP